MFLQKDREMLKRRNKFILVLFFALLISSAIKSQKNWWDKQWSARILFKVDAIRGPSVAMEVPTAGLTKPDASDIRIISKDGKKVIPHKILHVGPGDRLLLYFDAKPFLRNIKYGYIYLGNQKAQKPKKPWTGRHGVILEVRRLAAKSIRNKIEMLAAIKRSKIVLGRGFVDRIFQGMNPFGKEKRCLGIFSGYIYIRTPGLYTFATNSYDASLLMIDGKLVTSWLGWHGPEWRSSKFHSGSIKLDKGVHPFFYVNATRFRGILCSLGVKFPKAKTLYLAPPSLFIRWTKAVPILLEMQDQKKLAWFTWIKQSDLGLSGKDVVAVGFKDRTIIKDNQRRGNFWDFGDGTTSREKHPTHVFLESGVFPVTHIIYLKTGGQISLTQNVYVSPSGVPGWRIYQDVRYYAKILERYNPRRLSTKSLANAVFVMRAAKRYDDALPFLEQLIRKSGDMDTGNVSDEAFFLVDEIIHKKRDFAKALEILDSIRKGTRIKYKRLKAEVLMGEILYEYMDNKKLAIKYLNNVIKEERGRNSDILRFALIKKADILLEEGQRKKAEELLKRAQQMKRTFKFMGMDEATAGEHMVAYEEYAGRKDYASAMRELRAWEWDAPLDKLNGMMRFFKADLYVALGMPKEALREIRRMEIADPKNPELASAWIMASQCSIALGKKEEAIKFLKRILEEFPVSDAAKEAEKRLKKLEESIK